MFPGKVLVCVSTLNAFDFVLAKAIRHGLRLQYTLSSNCSLIHSPFSQSYRSLSFRWVGIVVLSFNPCAFRQNIGQKFFGIPLLGTLLTPSPDHVFYPSARFVRVKDVDVRDRKVRWDGWWGRIVFDEVLHCIAQLSHGLFSSRRFSLIMFSYLSQRYSGFVIISNSKILLHTSPGKFDKPFHLSIIPSKRL